MELDDAGGVVPQDMAVAESADLITLPPSVPGTNCFNCSFVLRADVKKSAEPLGFCRHRKVRQWVNERNCCKFWDNTEVRRPWGKQEQ